MPGPSLYTVYNQSMTERINDFYGNSTLFKNNMFYVGLWGEYVQSTIAELEQTSRVDPSMGNLDKKQSTKNVYTFENALNRWKDLYWRGANTEVELKWTCSAIQIPTIESKIDEGRAYSIDAIKPIQYPLISDYGGMKTVTLTIVEDRNMMMWHFFNTLHNQFYSTNVLKPKSSFHKIGMYCAVMQGDVLPATTITQEEKLDPLGNMMEDGSRREGIITDVPMMVYEFNSVVVTNVAAPEFSHENINKVSFKVTLQVPNTFQGSFKTTFRGLANNSSKRGGYSNGSVIDNNGIGTGGYNGIVYAKDTNDVLQQSNLNSASIFESYNVDGEVPKKNNTKTTGTQKNTQNSSTTKQNIQSKTR